MQVDQRMTKNPETVSPSEHLSTVQKRMYAGGFQHMPVVSGGKIVGIISDRDLRQYARSLDSSSVRDTMTEEVVTVAPESTIKEAAHMMLDRKIGGLPVINSEKNLVGMITTSDVMKAFLDDVGRSETSAFRIVLRLEKKKRTLSKASRTIAREGGEVLAIGTYREISKKNPVHYLRLRGVDPKRLKRVLKQEGFTVLGVGQ